MNPDNINTLYRYKVPPRGLCENCGEQETTLFYEIPSGEQLCNDCGREVTKSFEKRGIGLNAIEEIEYDSNMGGESGGQKAESSESVKIREILTEITPAQEFPGREEQVVEYEYDRIKWENVDDRDKVDDNPLVVWGGAPGSYDTVDASDFDAIEAYFDSSLTDANVVYVTDESTYVYDFVADQLNRVTLAYEVFSVLSSLSRNGDIEGLCPNGDVAPPDGLLYEQLELHRDIEDFEIGTSGDSLVCRVVLAEYRDQDSLLNDIRTVGGVRYPKPDEIQVVESLE